MNNPPVSPKAGLTIKLFAFYLLNALVLVLVLTSTDGLPNSLASLLENLDWRRSWIGVAASLAVPLVNGILPSYAKAVLVFHRLRNPLPGSRAFSELAARDSRINLGRLAERAGRPVEPAAQNGAWYSLFNRVRTAPSVIDAHANFLLLRDMTSYTAMLLVGSPVVLVFRQAELGVCVTYLGGLLLLYAACSLSARHYGNRLVTNVLALASA